MGVSLAVTIAAVAILVGACGGSDEVAGPGGSDDSGGSDSDPTTEEFAWDLPPGFPAPRVPEDNPMSQEKVDLGRHLFYDKRLSGNQTQSCASCHQQALAFTDGNAVGVGSTGEFHPRASMSLTNIAYQPVLTWADPDVTSLADQIFTPLFGDDPVELGMTGEDELFERLRPDETYEVLFEAAFPDQENPFTMGSLTKAVASFQRTLISGNAPEDRFRRGETDALSSLEQRGRELFFSETLTESGDELGCFQCHVEPFFTGTFDHQGKEVPDILYDNTGLYNLEVDGEDGWYPQNNTGLYEHTGDPEHMGRFKVPTLRNVALTAPYMHDGSVEDLDAVLDHYAAGGRTIGSGPFAGVGSENPHKSHLITGFTLTSDEREAVIAYLHAQTDEEFVTDERFSNPWPDGHPAGGEDEGG